MKFCNNPTRKLQRQKTALDRFPKKGNGKKTAHARTATQRNKERQILQKIISNMTEEHARGIKNKKDHSNKATLR